MTKYLIVGDTHGNVPFAEQMTRKAHALDIKTIVQVGDFGYWPQQDAEEVKAGLEPLAFEKKISKVAEELDVTWYFLPGNHEDWDALDQLEANSDQHFIQVAPRVFYTGRINVWQWDGITFASAGGAYSIDKNARTPGWDWFHQETLKDRDLWSLESMVALTDKGVDVLLTHDAPTWLEFPGRLIPIEASIQHRKMMDEVYKITSPSLWFHGHYHKFMDYKNYSTQVYGLDCDPGYAAGSFEIKNHMVFNADEWSVTYPGEEFA